MLDRWMLGRMDETGPGSVVVAAPPAASGGLRRVPDRPAPPRARPPG